MTIDNTQWQRAWQSFEKRFRFQRGQSVRWQQYPHYDYTVEQLAYRIRCGTSRGGRVYRLRYPGNHGGLTRWIFEDELLGIVDVLP